MSNTIQTRLRHGVRVSQKFLKSYWAFPAVLLVLIIGLATFGVSGSSVGSYDGLVNNTSPHFGPLPTRPRAIRSDEWLVNTQMTVAQYKDGFPVVNKHIGQGQDMTVVLDVPYKEWSVLFKPQNLIFFVAPLNFAFAFKWWTLAAVLAFSVYALFLKVFPRQRLAAILLAGSVFLAPMVQWWYQTITIMPVALGLLAITLLIGIHEAKSTRRRLVYAALLAYVVATFALVMYPPFQIPIAVTIVFFYLAFVLWQLRATADRRNRIQLLQTVSIVAAGTAVGCMIVGAYLLQHHAVISTISNTAYPGHRDIAAGNYSARHVLSNFLAPFYQSTGSVMHYGELLGGTNQSEISSFLFPVVPLLVLGIALLLRGARRRVTHAYSLVLAVCVALIIFLVRFFVPEGSGLYKLLALNLVPHNRLLIGVGFACIALIIGAARLLRDRPLNLPKKFGLPLLGLVTVGELLVLQQVIHHDPGFVSHALIAWCAIAATVGFLGLFMYGYLRSSLAVFLVFSLASTFIANPLQRNINEVTGTDFAHAIQAAVRQHPDARWISYKAVTFENYAAANGAKTLGGTNTYPQLALWHQIDPGGANKDTYNRYAHVEFEFDDSATKPQFILLAPDTFALKLSACSSFLTQEHVRYIYSMEPLSSSCLSLHDTFKHTNATIYLYERASS